MSGAATHEAVQRRVAYATLPSVIEEEDAPVSENALARRRAINATCDAINQHAKILDELTKRQPAAVIREMLRPRLEVAVKTQRLASALIEVTWCDVIEPSRISIRRLERCTIETPILVTLPDGNGNRTIKAFIDHEGEITLDATSALTCINKRAIVNGRAYAFDRDGHPINATMHIATHNDSTTLQLDTPLIKRVTRGGQHALEMLYLWARAAQRPMPVRHAATKVEEHIDPRLELIDDLVDHVIKAITWHPAWMVAGWRITVTFSMALLIYTLLKSRKTNSAPTIVIAPSTTPAVAAAAPIVNTQDAVAVDDTPASTSRHNKSTSEFQRPWYASIRRRDYHEEQSIDG